MTEERPVYEYGGGDKQELAPARPLQRPVSALVTNLMASCGAQGYAFRISGPEDGRVCVAISVPEDSLLFGHIESAEQPLGGGDFATAVCCSEQLVDALMGAFDVLHTTALRRMSVIDERIMELQREAAVLEKMRARIESVDVAESKSGLAGLNGPTG